VVAVKAGNYTPVVDEIEDGSCLNCVSLVSVFPALLSDAPILSSGYCSEPESPPAAALLVVFGGNPLVHIV
jgi:hypothetical protein